MKKITKVLFIVTVLFVNSTVFADTNIHLSIQADTKPIYNDDITVTPCDSDHDPLTPDTESVYCAVEQVVAELSSTSDWSWAFPPGAFLNSLDGFENNAAGNGIYWGWFLNLVVGQAGMNEYQPLPGDSILLQYNVSPLRITASSPAPTVGNTLTLTVEQSDYNSSYSDTWSQAALGKLVAGSTIYDLDNDGKYSLVIADMSPLVIKGQKTGFLDTSELTINPVALPNSSSGSRGKSTTTYTSAEPIVPYPTKGSFDLDKAFEFLVSEQKENGSFGEDIYTDWTALALASGNNQAAVLKLIRYLGSSKLENPRLTDYERRAMALLALGLNPYNTGGENYIGKIAASFDGKQFGDPKEDNDDVFALIVLSNAGYKQDEKIIASGINFVLGSQRPDGAWNGSVDMTGAAMVSLSVFSPTRGVGESLDKAKNFLKERQKDNGGWNDDVSSTAWAIQGILAAGEKPEDWKKDGKTPLDYLASAEDEAGGIKDENAKNKIWKTAYVVSALSGKTWSQTMQKFEKQEATVEAPKAIVIKPQVKQPAPKAAFKSVAAPKNEKLSAVTVQNTAAVINAVPEVNNAEETTPPERGWFKKLLGNIFGF